MSSFYRVSVVLSWILFLLASIKSENVTIAEDSGSKSSALSVDSTEPTGQTSAEVTNSRTTTKSLILLSGNPSLSTPKIHSESSSTQRASSSTGPSSVLGPSSNSVSSFTLGPSSTNESSSTLGPSSTSEYSSIIGPSSTSESSSTLGPSYTSESASTLGPRSTNESASTLGPNSTNESAFTLGPSSTSESSSTLGPSSTNESSSTLGPSSTNESSSTLGPSSTNESSSTLGPSSTNESASTLGPSSPTRPSSTPGPTSTIDSSLTNETLPSTYLPISTNSTNSSSIPIPKEDREKYPSSTKTTTIRTASAAKEHVDPSGGGGLPCTPTRRNGLVSQCLIAIASLAALATFFMVSCIIICTKYNSRKHCYAMSSSNRGTEMVCISTLLPDGSAPNWRSYTPRSNGALLHDTELDSDEEGGDNLTLHSFLPENDQRPESRV